MRILHVVPGMDPQLGGVCQAVRTSIMGLTALGVHNEVACLDAPDAPFLKADPFPVHALGPAKGPWAYSTTLLPWLIVQLPHFDAVIVHGLWLYYGYAVRQAMRRLPASGKRPKLYVMPHGMLDPYFQRAAGRKLKAMRNTLYWKVVEGHLVNDADGLLFTCEEERRLAQEPFRPYHPKRTEVVGLGVDEPPAREPGMQEAFQAKCPAVQNEPYLLFLSRIHEKKGVDLLLKAYAETLSNGSTGGALPKLVVAGPGLDTPYGQQMQELVQQSPALQATVLFPGMLTGAAKWGAFYGCEAFVLPSHQENFGIAVVEALACSKPVLISNQVNIWREIEAAGSGVAQADTLPGTQALLAHWQQLSPTEKVTFQQQARVGFQNNFAVYPAAQRFLEAVKS